PQPEGAGHGAGHDSTMVGRQNVVGDRHGTAGPRAASEPERGTTAHAAHPEPTHEAPALPRSWDKFDGAGHDQFTARLKAFRGNDNLNPDYSGGEGRVFAADGKMTALKRWFKARLSDMPASLSKLRQVRADIESHPKLSADIEVVRIHEEGPDWILRDSI